MRPRAEFHDSHVSGQARSAQKTAFCVAKARFSCFWAQSDFSLENEIVWKYCKNHYFGHNFPNNDVIFIGKIANYKDSAVIIARSRRENGRFGQNHCAQNAAFSENATQFPDFGNFYCDQKGLFS